MFLRSDVILFFILLCSAGFAFSQELTAGMPPSEQRYCHFYERVRDSDKLSDPAHQVKSFIENNWLVLENDLARGRGGALSYLHELSACNYPLPNNYWSRHLRLIPLKERAPEFTNYFLSKCFCSRG